MIMLTAVYTGMMGLCHSFIQSTSYEKINVTFVLTKIIQDSFPDCFSQEIIMLSFASLYNGIKLPISDHQF